MRRCRGLSATTGANDPTLPFAAALDNAGPRITSQPKDFYFR
jgi:hypothetical protein